MRSRSSTRPDALHEIGKLVNKLLDDDGDTQAEQELAYVLGKAIWPAHDRTFRRAEQLVLDDVRLPSDQQWVAEDIWLLGGRADVHPSATREALIRDSILS